MPRRPQRPIWRREAALIPSTRDDRNGPTADFIRLFVRIIPRQKHHRCNSACSRGGCAQSCVQVGTVLRPQDAIQEDHLVCVADGEKRQRPQAVAPPAALDVLAGLSPRFRPPAGLLVDLPGSLAKEVGGRDPEQAGQESRAFGIAAGACNPSASTSARLSQPVSSLPLPAQDQRLA